MEENISRERKLLFRSGMILVSGICAIAAGLTLGSGIRVLGGPDLRIVLCCLFAVALLFQGYYYWIGFLQSYMGFDRFCSRHKW